MSPVRIQLPSTPFTGPAVGEIEECHLDLGYVRLGLRITPLRIPLFLLTQFVSHRVTFS
jgi:hypothetical protein